jgi:DNA-nicking Smr family endonuclease
MPKRRLLSLEENIIWHKIAKTVTPADPEKMNALLSAISLPRDPKSAKSAKALAPDAQSAFVASPKRAKPPVAASIADASRHKAVRRGKLEIDATIDLHGMTQDKAQEQLISFLLGAVNQHYRCVLVITGKGNNIGGPHAGDFWVSPRGIIRARVKDWLHAPIIRKYIAGISQANQKHGGYGAFYVLLKHHRN